MTAAKTSSAGIDQSWFVACDFLKIRLKALQTGLNKDLKRGEDIGILHLAQCCVDTGESSGERMLCVSGFSQNLICFNFGK